LFLYKEYIYILYKMSEKENTVNTPAEVPEEGGKITKEQLQGLLVLIQAVTLSQKRGTFSLSEAEQVSQAVKLFVAQNEESEAKSEETNELSQSPQ